MKSLRLPAALFAIALSALAAGIARAEGLPTDASAFSDPNSLISEDIAKPFIMTIGFATDHRPFEPATPLNTGDGLGLDAGLELTLVQLSDSFIDALNRAGLETGDLPIRVLPVPRANVHKGLSKMSDLGVSFVYFRGYRLYGADFKLVVHRPEEGPTWAIRLCYSAAKFGFVETTTLTPQLLISKAMHFSDPYLGVAYQMTFGKIRFELPKPDGWPDGVEWPEVWLEHKSKAKGFLAFVGVSLKMPFVGARLTLEGAYSGSGMHQLGTKLGIQF